MKVQTFFNGLPIFCFDNLMKILMLTFFCIFTNFNLIAQGIDTVSFTCERNAGHDFVNVCMYATDREPFTVYWGDGSMTTYMQSNFTQIGNPTITIERPVFLHHRYAVCGTYTVSIVGSPTCQLFRLNFSSSINPLNPIVSVYATLVHMSSPSLWDLGTEKEKIIRINRNFNRPINVLIASRYNWLTLTQLDSIGRLISNNPFAQPQYLNKQIITPGDTINFYSETIFTKNGITHQTVFDVYRKDTVGVTPPYQYPNLLYLNDTVLQTAPGDYILTNGIFVFYNPGEYVIRMRNPNVTVFSPFNPSEIAEVFQYVTVLPKDSLNGVTIPIIYAQICKGGVYNQHGFNERQEGVFTRAVPDINGCDSVITLHLSYYPSADTAHIQAEICAGGRYNLNGFNVSQAGTHYRTAQSQNGCDSVIALHLSYYAAIDTTKIKAAICKNAVYNLNGFHVNQAGIYHRTAQSLNGCDSVIQLNLTVSDVIRDTISTAICEGETYHLNGFNENLAGVYQRMVQTANGCDSLVVLQLSVNPVSRTPLKQSICEGGIYVFGGQNLSTAGTYTQTLVNQYGCDSIVDLTLEVNSASTTPLSAWITCKDSIYSFAGKDLNLAGVYYDTLHTAYGCDSILVLTLGMDSVLSDFEITTSGFLCEDKQVELTAMAENVDYLWNTGETARTIRIWTEGVYSVEVAMGQCQKFKEIEVSCPCKMYLPNIFSPNGDGFNDVYIPEVDFELVQFSMFIYDKWGNVAYKTNTYSGWNGKINGKDASAGVYYCVIEYYNTKYPDKKCIANSSVTLVR